MDKTQNFSNNQPVSRNLNYREYRTVKKVQNARYNRIVYKNHKNRNDQTVNTNQNFRDNQNVNTSQKCQGNRTADDDQLYHPIRIKCERCGFKVVPIQRKRPSCKTHVIATILFFVFCPCSIVPYYIDSLQATDLYCPHCNSHLATV